MTSEMHAWRVASDVVGDLVEEPLPDDAEELLIGDDAVVHLAVAHRELQHADASGIPLSMIPYSNVEEALRSRCHDLLIESMQEAEDRTRWEAVTAEFQESAEAATDE